MSKIAYKGEIPTPGQLERLFQQTPTKIEMVGDWNYYEENIQFDHVRISWLNDSIDVAGYWGLWEIMHPELLHHEAFAGLANNLHEWMEWHLVEAFDGVELFKVETPQG
jgi:hypothetical protein